MNKKLYAVFHVVAGIYAGVCIGIAAVDLRFINSISNAPHSLQVFSGLLKNMGQLMVPQLVTLTCLGLYFSVLAVLKKQPIFRHLPLLILAMILLTTLAVHIPINLKVFSGQVDPAEVSGLVKRWEFWHWVRTIIAVALPISIVKQTRFLT